MSDEAAKPEEEEILPAQARRQAAAETVTIIAETFDGQAGQARQIAMDARGKCSRLWPLSKQRGGGDPDDLKEAAAKLKLDMTQPGPNLVQRIINKIRGG